MKRFVCLILAILALGLFPSMARAHSTPTVVVGWTGTYKETSPDKQYVLIMLNGEYTPPYEGVSHETDEANKLLLKYPLSGLYKNDGSIIPLWVIEYMPFWNNITLSSDGHHLAIVDGSAWDTRTYSDLALAFYNDGRLMTRYNVADLVEAPEKLPNSDNYYDWFYNASIDDARGQLTVKTHNRKTYVFSLSTGRAINRNIATAVPYKRRSIPTSVPTTLPGIIDPDASLSTNKQDYTLAMGLLLTGGSLGTLFAGVGFLSRKAHRKHQSNLYSGSSVTLAPAPTTLRLKSRTTGRKVTLRRPRANTHKQIH